MTTNKIPVIFDEYIWTDPEVHKAVLRILVERAEEMEAVAGISSILDNVFLKAKAKEKEKEEPTPEFDKGMERIREQLRRDYPYFFNLIEEVKKVPLKKYTCWDKKGNGFYEKIDVTGMSKVTGWIMEDSFGNTVVFGTLNRLLGDLNSGVANDWIKDSSGSVKMYAKDWWE